MTKKLLILVDRIGDKIEFLSKELDATTACFTDLFFDINGSKFKVLVKGIDISKFGVVYIRRADHSHFSLAGSLARVLDKLGVKYFDRNFSEIGASGDKLTSYLKLAMGGIPVPHTIFCMGDSVKRYEDYIIEKLGFPIIAKELVGQRMTGIYAISNKRQFDDLPKVAGENKRVAKYLFQKRINLEKEYRLLVLKDKVAVLHTKVSRDYSNLKLDYSDPNQHEKYLDVNTIDIKMQEIAVRAAKCLNIQIAGVDLAIEKDTNKPYIIEVNRGPGINYDMSISPEISELSKFFKEELLK